MDFTFTLFILIIFGIDYIYKDFLSSKKTKQRRHIKSFIKNFFYYYRMNQYEDNFLNDEIKADYQQILLLKKQRKSLPQETIKFYQNLHDKYAHNFIEQDRTLRYINKFNHNIFIFIVVFSFRVIFIQPFQIPTNSMYPNLLGIQTKINTDAQPENKILKLRDRLTYGRQYFSLNITIDELQSSLNQEQSQFASSTRIGDQVFPGNIFNLTKALKQYQKINYSNYPEQKIILKGYTQIGDHLFINRPFLFI